MEKPEQPSDNKTAEQNPATSVPAEDEKLVTMVTLKIEENEKRGQDWEQWVNFPHCA
jgi:hypothetical protein